MLTTEEEAKTKRCPESFAACQQVTEGGYVIPAPITAGASGASGYAMQTAPSLCLGSACMAWRWAGYIAEGVERSVRMLSTTDPAAPNSTVKWQRLGYCGKAGRP